MDVNGGDGGGDCAEAAAPQEPAAAELAAGLPSLPLCPLPTRAKRPACCCETGEGCHVCGKCVERHCACGRLAPRRAERLVCRESRACDCILADPVAQRCEFCRGCRRKDQRVGHCRCLEHQRLFRQLQAAKAADNDRERQQLLSGASCSCFLLFPPRMLRDKAETLAIQQRKRDRTKRLGVARRWAGVPSIENLFKRKIALSSDNSSSGEQDDNDDEVDEKDEILSLGHPSLRNYLTGKIRKAKVPTNRVPVGKDGATLLESIEPQRKENVDMRGVVSRVDGHACQRVPYRPTLANAVEFVCESRYVVGIEPSGGAPG